MQIFTYYSHLVFKDVYFLKLINGKIKPVINFIKTLTS